MNNIENIIKSVSKDIDFEGLITTLDDIKKIDTISTGIVSLDNILGIGGIPRGLVSEIYGNAGTAKSSLCLSIISQAQKLGLKCAYIDLELAMTKELADKMHVNMDELIYAQPLSGEDSMELVNSLLDKDIKLIVIDSVSAMVPEDEMERDMNQDSIGLQARMMSKFMRKIIGKVKMQNAALIFINQIRDDIGKFGFGPKTTTSGGRALKFYSSLRLECARTGWLKSGTEKIGMSVKLSTAKNKLSTPMKQTNVNFYFDKGFAIDEDILMNMLGTGEIEVQGRTYFVVGDKVGDKKAILEWINNNNK